MNIKQKKNKKLIRHLKRLLRNKRVISAIITAIILFALVQPILDFVVDIKIDALPVKDFIRGYLLTARHFFQALWDGAKNVFQQIWTLFSVLFSMVWHPEKSLTDTLTAFVRGFWNSIRYLFRGSDTSIGTVFLKLVKIEKEGMISLTKNIINSIINLLNGVIDIINHLFDISAQKIPFLSW